MSSPQDQPSSQLTADVLVVGAGPTGLMAANQLHRFGIDFIIIDKKSGPTIESRAIAVTARSLEIYQQLGLSDEVVQKGQRIEVGNLFFGGKRKATIKLGELGKGMSEFSYLLAYEQSKNEALLSQNLESKGAIVHWEHEFVSLLNHKDSIEAVAVHNGNKVIISAKYLVACDGASSPIRQQLKFSFRGGTYKHKFFVADSVINWSLPYQQLIITPGSFNFCAFLPLKGDTTYRIIGTLPGKYFEKEDITFEDIKDVVEKSAGTKIIFEEVNWFSTYKLHHRGVNHFRDGNVFLAGDSAHIHSPAGGQGMNTGLQDAYNLCWKLAMVIKGKASKELLDTYNEERLPFAKWLLRFTDRGFNMMTNTNPFIRFFRRYVTLNIAGFVSQLSFIRPVIFRVISQIWYSYNNYSLAHDATKQNLKFKAGDRFPFLGEENVYPQLTGPSFHLVCLSNSELDSSGKEALNQMFPFPVKIIELKISDSWKKLGVENDLYILVRPDNYILLTTDSIYEKITERNFANYFSKN